MKIHKNKLNRQKLKDKKTSANTNCAKKQLNQAVFCK
jgi:hypothetical protein